MRVNARYLYCHRGTCEHFVYVSNIRLFNSRKDPIEANMYPLVTFKGKTQYRVCDACKAWGATKVVCGDRLSRTGVAFYCDNCHHALHYDSSASGTDAPSRLLYDDFRVFPYLYDD